MTRPAREPEVVEIKIPVARLKKHFANRRDLLEVNEALAQDDFSRKQRSLSLTFYRVAAATVLFGSIGGTVIVFDSNKSDTQKSVGYAGAALCTILPTAVFLTGGRLTRPHTPPLSKEDRSNREKERQGRLDSYNAFYRQHFRENPTLYTARRFGE